MPPKKGKGKAPVRQRTRLPRRERQRLLRNVSDITNLQMLIANGVLGARQRFYQGDMNVRHLHPFFTLCSNLTRMCESTLAEHRPEEPGHSAWSDERPRSPQPSTSGSLDTSEVPISLTISITTRETLDMPAGADISESSLSAEENASNTASELSDQPVEPAQGRSESTDESDSYTSEPRRSSRLKKSDK